MKKEGNEIYFVVVHKKRLEFCVREKLIWGEKKIEFNKK